MSVGRLEHLAMYPMDLNHSVLNLGIDNASYLTR